MVTDRWAFNLATMQYPISVQGEVMFVRGKGSVGEKRNKAINYALTKGHSHIFFLDDDVIIPPYTLRAMWHHNKDIIYGIYYTKTKYSMPLVFEKEGAGAWMDYPKDQLFEVWGGSQGCCLIKTEIFKQMKMPYFYTPPAEEESTLKKGTEEHHFWKQCDEFNIKRYCDSTIQCGHIDKTDFDEGGNPAIYFKGEKIKNQPPEDE
jgi:hypothetical protein